MFRIRVVLGADRYKQCWNRTFIAFGLRYNEEAVPRDVTCDDMIVTDTHGEPAACSNT
jgi:hypothetical protein